ncbi:hypothetical protein GGF42_003857 [Coemansia sp. RSA 2424]|nr:hypothetical protein GGF42_003857 [Coemansia sp. RSA 2424]
MCIFRTIRSKVDDETKRLKNREFLQLMSARWKGMPESERSPYVKLAEDDKRRFNDDVKKFGKYESRQRRYNKSRHTSKDVPGQSTPYTMPPGSSRYSSTTAGFLYNSGYAAMAAQPTQEQANAAAAAARFPAFYVGLPAGPQASVAATASWQPSVVPGMANSAVTVPVGMQQVQAQPNALLCPPGLLAQRTSLSSSGSSNEPNEIQQTSVSPRFPWMPAAARSPGGQMEAGKYNVYYQQQPPVGNYVQVPTGAPISHSLTEPVFYGDSRAQPHIAAAVQAQIQNSQVLAHQQQQQQRAFQAHNYHTLA